ncbi:MAG: hypothetical protein JSS99_14260 [Actinobacteria bacterium]|nr:hypothetical protein [Actinomycetota bacterium]
MAFSEQRSLQKRSTWRAVHGLADLAKELRVEIQAITEEDLDLKTISADVQIDRAKLEQFHRAFVEFDVWQQSLAAFGAYGPPGGEPDAVEEQFEQQMRDHPLPYLSPNHQGALCRQAWRSATAR